MKRRSRSIKYDDALREALKDPEEAAEYLNAALEDGDAEIFLMALRYVSDAYGGMARVAKKSRLNRENLYRMLSKRGNPELISLNRLLTVFGLRLAVEVG